METVSLVYVTLPTHVWQSRQRALRYAGWRVVDFSNPGAPLAPGERWPLVILKFYGGGPEFSRRSVFSPDPVQGKCN